jgi:PAS domain S-box-containing protein
MGARLGVAGLCLALLAASYVSAGVRRRYGRWMQGGFYVVISWFTLVTALNGFADGYAVGLLLLFTVLTAVIGHQARGIRPIVWFSTYVFVAAGLGVVARGPAARGDGLILLAGIATVALVEGVVARERTAIRAALRERERQYRTLTENISEGVFRATPEGLVHANQTFARMFGYERAGALSGVEFSALCADPDRAGALWPRLEEGGTAEPVEFECRRKDGSTFTGRLRGTAVRAEDGTIQYYDGTLVDVTERKRRKQELARRKALLEAQAEATIDGLLVVDPDRALVFYNDRFLEVWGLSADVVEQSAPGTSPDPVLLDVVSDRLANPEEFRRTVEHLYEHPAEESRDLIRLVDGRWLDRYTAPIVGDAGRHFGRLWVFRDVSEQRRMQERLLEVQEQERRRIHQEIHDEVGGLLASLQMEVGLARAEAGKADGAPGAIDRIEGLVTQLSTATRTISRKLYPSALADYGLAGTLPSLVDEMEETHALTIDLQSELEPEDRFSALVERTAYWIVQEALVNAARHAETDAARVTVRRCEAGLALRVTDEGVGFGPSEEEGAKSFGLEGIRRRVERLDGDVRIESTPGEGTRVAAILPVAATAAPR